jgi:hypothetical protein
VEENRPSAGIDNFKKERRLSQGHWPKIKKSFEGSY